MTNKHPNRRRSSSSGSARRKNSSPRAADRVETREKSKAVLVQILEELRRRYEEYRDPLRAWEAYKVARNFSAWGVEIPSWVLAYLDGVAQGIGLIEDMPRKQGLHKGRTISELAAAALGIGPGAGPYVISRRLTRGRDAALGDAVAQFIMRQGKHRKERAAINYVAKKWQISTGTVGNAYRALKATGRFPTE